MSTLGPDNNTTRFSESTPSGMNHNASPMSAGISSSTPDLPGQADGLVATMDGVVRKAGAVITGGSAPDRRAAPETAAGEHKESVASTPRKHTMGYIIRSGIAGGLAGCAAKTTVAPLDRVKILFQTNNPQFAKYQGSWTGVIRAMGDIYARDGMYGLFRGHSATLLKIYPYAAIKFVAYEQYRAFLISSREQETWIRRFSAGALAGVTSVFITYPLDVVRVRLAFETKNRSSGLSEIIYKIYHEQPLPKNTGEGATAAAIVTPRSGIVNFYRGFSTTLLGMVPYAGISFLTHDTMGDLLRMEPFRQYTTLPQPANAPKDKPAPLQAWAQLTAGGVSGAVAQTISYPLEVIRRRMQVAGAVGDRHRLRIMETAGMIIREKGFRGFFVGLTIGYVKIVPLAAVSFYTYERMKSIFGI